MYLVTIIFFQIGSARSNGVELNVGSALELRRLVELLGYDALLLYVKVQEIPVPIVLVPQQKECCDQVSNFI